MKLTILGCNGAIPAYGRFPSAQLLNINQQLMLIDCGEGAQILLQKYKISILKIHHIFISHMHGDHYFGLIGLLNTMALLGKTSSVHLYCPERLKPIIDIQLDYDLPYQIVYHFLVEESQTCLINTSSTEVWSFKVYHSVPTWGFMFIEKKRKRKLLPDKIRAYEIPHYFLSRVAEGEDYTRKDGEVIKNDQLSIAGDPWRKYVYSADTRFAPEILPIINQADCLYHESTYLQTEIIKAEQRFHTTALQAATLAQKADVKQLIIGHFSSLYKTHDELLLEAKSVFENTIAAEEALCIEI